MTITELMKNLNNTTAEEAINGTNTDPSFDPIEGTKPVFECYDVDIDITRKFRNRLNLSDNDLEKINRFLNKKSLHYSGRNKRCPICGKALDLVGNDGHFCKFCGAHLKTENTKNFPQALKEIRTKNNIGQTELGKLMGNSASYICNLEKGNRIPTVQDLIKLTHIFKCSVNELFGQDAPRQRINTPCSDENITYQENLPSKEARTPDTEEDISGYSVNGKEEMIFRCPHCREEIDLTPMEALSLNLPSYETMRTRTHGNDGHFCKHCGQGIIRPIKINENKAFNSYTFWIDYAVKQCL